MRQKLKFVIAQTKKVQPLKLSEMNSETKLIKNKLGLLKLAEEIVRFDGVNWAMFLRHASI